MLEFNKAMNISFNQNLNLLNPLKIPYIYIIKPPLLNY